MKLRTSGLIFAALLSIVTAVAQPAATWTSGNGSYLVNRHTRIVADKSLQPLVQYLRLYLPLNETTRHPAATPFILRIDSKLPQEGYQLTVEPAGLEITGGSYGGVFNGIQALFRRMPASIYSRKLDLPVSVACGHEESAPRFAFRGMMLDVARTWVDAAHLKRYIDLISYQCINKLHLHLTDDEGWRIEIKSHPELTRIGAYRGGNSPIKPVYGKWNETYGGYYSQTQMRDLINYAAQRNIEIIPEIDLPGHSRDIASIYPEIRCNYPLNLESANGYDYRSAWCVAREENYQLLDEILGEICRLFPAHEIHVGGDEVDMSQWKACPDCQKLMREQGMKDPHQLEDLFMARVAKILAIHGKQAGVWNEAINGGGLSRESLVFGWHDTKVCLDATQKGYKTVVMPATYFYFDMRQSPSEAGHDWASITDVKKSLSFDFVQAGFTPEQMANVVGVEAAFWSEAYIGHNPERPDYLDYMTFPRLCALARIGWNGEGGSWEDFYRNLREREYDRLTAMRAIFRLMPPQIQRDSTGLVTAQVDDRSQLYYKLDGKTHRYIHPLFTDNPEEITFFSRRGTGVSPDIFLPEHDLIITPAVKITTSLGENPRAPIAQAERYKGLARTARTCRQKDWILYSFQEPVVCREIFIQTGNRQLPKTIFTTGYAEVSYDGTKFERLGRLDRGAILFQPENPVKAIRVVSTCSDNGTPFVSIQPPIIKVKSEK